VDVYRQVNLNGCSTEDGEITCQPDPPHRFNGTQRGAILTAVGATRSVANGGDGRGVIDSHWSSSRSVSDGGNSLEQHPEHCFDDGRREANLAASEATRSAARGEEAFTATGAAGRVIGVDYGSDSAFVMSGDRLERRFDGTRRLAELAATEAAWSLAKECCGE